jgi:O-glycosyl hydrolase
VAQLQVLVVIKRVPGEWMNGDKSLKTQCEGYVGNWWVAAVNRLKAVGVDVQWIELFNEPKYASWLILQSMFLFLGGFCRFTWQQLVYYSKGCLYRVTIYIGYR